MSCSMSASTASVTTPSARSRDHSAEIARLRAELASVRETLAAFKRDLLGDDLVFPHDWQLTRRQIRILAALACSPGLNRDQLMTAVYRFDAFEPDPGTIHAHMSHLRRKVAPRGIVIRSQRGVGYQIDAATRADIRARYRVRAGESRAVPA